MLKKDCEPQKGGGGVQLMLLGPKTYSVTFICNDLKGVGGFNLSQNLSRVKPQILDTGIYFTCDLNYFSFYDLYGWDIFYL